MKHAARRGTYSAQPRESEMSTGEIAYLSLVLATFGVFGAGMFWQTTSEAISLRRAGLREQALRVDTPAEEVVRMETLALAA
jgi:hypothetical protein